MTRRVKDTDVGISLFDKRPLTVGGFSFSAWDAKPASGKPTITGFQEALVFASGTYTSSPYWIAALMAYGESREDWQEKLAQAMSVTGLERGTLINLLSVYRRVEAPERALAQSVGHADAVAALPRAQQTKWLDKSRTEGWSVRELRGEIRVAKRTRVIEGQATLAGMYRVWMADPPWPYDDSAPTADGSLGKAERHYGSMSLDEICALPVQAHALPHSVLLMWATAPVLLQNPGPREVVEAWGFTYKANLVWDKVLGNPGHYGMQVTHEHLIIATRGNGTPDKPLPHDDSVLTVRRGDEHSAKPDEVVQFIERHWTTGPYVELFAREKRKGWTTLGNDARLWEGEGAK